MKLWNECQKLSLEDVPFVMATLFNIRGSAPQDNGAKILVTQHGLHAGTVGGGKIEAAVIQKAKSILAQEKEMPPELITWNLQKDIGMSCGGEASFLFEYFHTSNWKIVIFGAGHVAQALVPILKTLDCHITCIDGREEWLEKFQGVKTIKTDDPKLTVKDFNKKTFFLCLSKGHDHDFPVLLEIANAFPDANYVGCIGSDTKALKMKSQLKAAGVSQKFLNKLRIPVGLSIGTNHIGEIAISIAAELIQTRDQIVL